MTITANNDNNVFINNLLNRNCVDAKELLLHTAS